MATRKAREIKEGLTKKGFIAVQRDHTYLFFSVEGRKSGVHTKISHGNKDYGDNIFYGRKEEHLLCGIFTPGEIMGFPYIDGVRIRKSWVGKHDGIRSLDRRSRP